MSGKAKRRTRKPPPRLSPADSARIDELIAARHEQTAWEREHIFREAERERQILLRADHTVGPWPERPGPQGLNEAGFVEGQNVAIEFRAAEGQNDRLPALVADLIRRPVAVIVGDTISTLAAKAATSTVPIVFATGGDPVKQGMATSMNRPGGNVTGVSFFGGVLGAKRLELVRQLVPKAKTIAMFVSPDAPTTEAERRDVSATSRPLLQRSANARPARCSSGLARS